MDWRLRPPAHVVFQLWQVYLDNLDMLEIVDEAALSEWVRSTSRSTDDARAVYELYKVQRSVGKSLVRLSRASC